MSWKRRKHSTKITIGVASYRGVLIETWASTLQIRGTWPDAVWDSRKGADVVYSRNSIAHGAMKRGSKGLVFIDTDMIFDTSHFARLLARLKESPRCGAVSGFSCKWDGSALPALNWRHPDGRWYSDEERRARADSSTGLVQVHSFGGGFLAISREALEKVEFPWFEAGYDRLRPDAYYDGDTGFCRKLAESGFEPSVDFDLVIGHMGPTLWVPQRQEVKRAV